MENKPIEDWMDFNNLDLQSELASTRVTKSNSKRFTKGGEKNKLTTSARVTHSKKFVWSFARGIGISGCILQVSMSLGHALQE